MSDKFIESLLRSGAVPGGEENSEQNNLFGDEKLDPNDIQKLLAEVFSLCLLWK